MGISDQSPLQPKRADYQLSTLTENPIESMDRDSLLISMALATTHSILPPNPNASQDSLEEGDFKLEVLPKPPL